MLLYTFLENCPLEESTAESTDDITAAATAPRPNNATTFGQRCLITKGKTNGTSSSAKTVQLPDLYDVMLQSEIQNKSIAHLTYSK